MIRVVRGATGFWGQGDDPLPLVDVGAFKTACHAVARSIRATVGEVTPAGVTPSFHTVLITAPGIGSTVLCHEVLPVVAFAASRPQAGAPLADFTSPPAWADAFELGGFRLLDVEELSMPLAAADTSELAEAELEQVRYWRPSTVGELMFNWWD
ncbi:hypothetical protein MUK60_11960 [Streptomyces sp. LRE541]|uniref:hypothetical protein n=1 Tax=Streptomyces sp. LRE541 TaxID=2931983 RepID=UPI00200F0023|nr:hypothetical protein [Streptomyces sp. LRE541]UPZ28471.1 hypothetical protein MUK60_11960 [Streptomyces sp. LRE541]